MKRFGMWVVVVAVLLAFAGGAYAEGEKAVTINKFEDLRNDVVREAHEIIAVYWNILEMRYQFNELKGVPEEHLVCTYKAEMAKFEKLSKALSGRVIKTLRANDLRTLEFLSELYASKQIYEKPAFEVAVREILDFLKSEASNGRPVVDPKLLDDESRAQYFPGYGYADPNYIYRKGREIQDETISTYWQEETKVWESNKHFEGVIDFKLAAELKATTANFKELSEPFKLDIGGHLTLCIKVSFDVKESLTTKATKQYAVHKIWFELFRADRNYWSSPKWELCGKTYELHDLPTGLTATIGIKK